MNNTELTLDQLAEVAGGAPHYTDYGGLGFMSRAIIHPNFKTGLHDSVHCFRKKAPISECLGKQVRRLETRLGFHACPNR